MEEMPISAINVKEFISIAKNHSLSDEFILRLLRAQSWPERLIMQAFAEYYEKSLGTAVPKHEGNSEAARDAFYYLLNFITLAFWSFALGKFLILLIDWNFPDTQTHFYGSLLHNLAWPIATFIVTFPAFVIVHLFIAKQLRVRRDLYGSGVRKWLTYIALVVAACVLLSDGIWFVQRCIQSDISLGFVLHVLVLLVIGGGIFLYYLSTMQAPHGREIAAED
jgi:hypothetical protein